MKFLLATSLAAALSWPAAAVVVGDSREGAAVFEGQKCVSCHSVAGKGGKSAPDLGKRTGRGYVPSEMAALMWNHAPAMWSAIQAAGIDRPRLSLQQSADLFAFFYAARYFDPPGDAGRGRKAFVSKGCAGCHNVGSANAAGGPPVMNWESVADTIELSRQMWNHEPQMRAAMEKRGMKPPQLTAAEMNDILVYLQNLPQVKKLQPHFTPGPVDTGEMLFKAKGCTSCHQGTQSLAKHVSFRTTSDFAVSMWNHAAGMKHTGELRPEEMRRLAAYIWALQFEHGTGNPARGLKVYSEKGCNGCHASGPGPQLTGKSMTAYGMVSSLWGHGPAMLAQMKAKNVAWPRFRDAEMADLIAFLAEKK
jgi:mono/diheme cytochrome c family protein